ncbi:MAG: SBBP repeat-containing protein [Candidatus Lokiarchaeota archaeon]|nr:SBBP repeat-containing protein [Candidatus Lokiarchaeota archaeon]
MRNRSHKGANALMVTLLTVFVVILASRHVNPGVMNEGNQLSDGELDNSDTVLWTSYIDGPGYDYAKDVAIDDYGNVYVVGYADFDVFGEDDAIVAKYDSQGREVWRRFWGGASYDYGYGVDVDSTGSVVFTGYTRSFGSDYQAFVCKMDPDGTLLWNVTWGGAPPDRAYDVAVGEGDNVYACGQTQTMGAGSDDMLLLKLDPSGNLLLNVTWGTSQHERAEGMCFNSTDSIYIAGVTMLSGTRDVALVKFNSTGGVVWNRTWGGTGTEDGQSVDCSGDKVYVVSTGNWGGSFVLHQYNSTGGLAWSTSKAMGGNADTYKSLACDSHGDIYVLSYNFTQII